MHPYLQDTEYAVQNLFALIGNEVHELSRLESELESAIAERDAYGFDFRTSDLNDDFSEYHVIHAFNRMSAASQRAGDLSTRIANIEIVIDVRDYSKRALQGAVLQIARQGISAVYGQLINAPEGRRLGSANIKEIIWHSRNQASHYETPITNPQTIALFLKLEQENGSAFRINADPLKPLTDEVFSLMGWFSYEHYLEDMRSLLP